MSPGLQPRRLPAGCRAGSATGRWYVQSARSPTTRRRRRNPPPPTNILPGAPSRRLSHSAADRECLRGARASASTPTPAPQAFVQRPDFRRPRENVRPAALRAYPDPLLLHTGVTARAALPSAQRVFEPLAPELGPT